jgi:hypothetical protein
VNYINYVRIYSWVDAVERVAVRVLATKGYDKLRLLRDLATCYLAVVCQKTIRFMRRVGITLTAISLSASPGKQFKTRVSYSFLILAT